MSGIENFAKIMPGVGTAASVASGFLNGLDSIFGWSQKQQEKSQKALMDKQQDQWKEQQDILAGQQLEQWNRENEYNDPTNYYKRLLDGAEANGISKAVALGQSPGGTVGQSATGVTAPGSPSMTSTSGAPSYNIGSGLMSSMRHVAEVANIEADTHLKESQAGYIPVQQQLTEAMTAVQNKNLEVMDQDIAVKIAQEDDYRASADLKRAQKDFTKANELLVKAQEAKTQKDIDKCLKEIEKLTLDNAIVEKYGLARAKAELDRTKALTALSLAERAVANNLAKKYGVETAMQKMQNGVYMKTMSDLIKQIKGESQVAQAEGKYAEAYQLNNLMPTGFVGDVVKTLNSAEYTGLHFDAKNLYQLFIKELDRVAYSE